MCCFVKHQTWRIYVQVTCVQRTAFPKYVQTINRHWEGTYEMHIRLHTHARPPARTHARTHARTYAHPENIFPVYVVFYLFFCDIAALRDTWLEAQMGLPPPSTSYSLFHESQSTSGECGISRRWRHRSYCHRGGLLFEQMNHQIEQIITHWAGSMGRSWLKSLNSVLLNTLWWPCD